MKKKFIPTGEQEFVTEVVKAVIKNDTSKMHILADCHGIITYISYPKDHKFDEIVDSYGRPTKMLCVFSTELITNFHLKAGNDDLAKGWAKRAVKSVIKHGKEVSKNYYENEYEEFKKNIKRSRIVVIKED